MNIIIEWHNDQFNINLASAEGKDAFMSVKGCRIKEFDGKEFVGFPARKNEKTGKWWNHVWASDEFQKHVIKLAKAAMPASQKAPSRTGGIEDMSDDIPF